VFGGGSSLCPWPAGRRSGHDRETGGQGSPDVAHTDVGPLVCGPARRRSRMSVSCTSSCRTSEEPCPRREGGQQVVTNGEEWEFLWDIGDYFLVVGGWI
jgi:hypothetical protein